MISVDEATLWITAVTAVTGWIGCYWQWREKKKAERELNEQNRRCHAPYLVPSDDFKQTIYDRNTEGICGWPYNGPNILSVDRNEVEKSLSRGDDVILLVKNCGEHPIVCQVKLDGDAIELCREPEFNSARGFQFLKYAYNPSKHGQDQRIVLAFETQLSGPHTHTYLTKHGFRVLIRIDPA